MIQVIKQSLFPRMLYQIPHHARFHPHALLHEALEARQLHFRFFNRSTKRSHLYHQQSPQVMTPQKLGMHQADVNDGNGVANPLCPSLRLIRKHPA
jgi:hypothetical protein